MTRELNYSSEKDKERDLKRKRRKKKGREITLKKKKEIAPYSCKRFPPEGRQLAKQSHL